MTALSDNVVFLNNGKDNVYSAIRTYIQRIEQESPNTAKTYLRHYEDFFKTMRNKTLQQLTSDDLIFTKQEIESYQISLRQKYKANTVNNTISSLKSLYTKLKDYKYPVESDWFVLTRYKDYDKESYDILMHEEVINIVNLIGKTRKGFEKQLLIRVAYATAFRLSAILELKWKDLKITNGFLTLHALDKGKKHDVKKISQELYDDLIKLKEEENASSEDKIFKLTKKTINKMMNYIRENMDFGERIIVFHSFKKASITQVGILTNGDVKAMQRHGNHSSAKTTMDNYVKETDLDDMMVVDVNYKVDLSKFDELSKEDLLQLIKSADSATQIKLLQKLTGK